MSRLFNRVGAAGLTPEGVSVFNAIQNYMYFLYKDSMEMGIPSHEITAMLARVAVTLESRFIIAEAEKQKEIKTGLSGRIPAGMKHATGYGDERTKSSNASVDDAATDADAGTDDDDDGEGVPV